MIRGPYSFYAQMFAIEVAHGDFIARYGEAQEKAFVREGDHVIGVLRLIARFNVAGLRRGIISEFLKGCYSPSNGVILHS